MKYKNFFLIPIAVASTASVAVSCQKKDAKEIKLSAIKKILQNQKSSVFTEEEFEKIVIRSSDHVPLNEASKILGFNEIGIDIPDVQITVWKDQGILVDYKITILGEIPFTTLEEIKFNKFSRTIDKDRENLGQIQEMIKSISTSNLTEEVFSSKFIDTNKPEMLNVANLQLKLVIPEKLSTLINSTGYKISVSKSKDSNLVNFWIDVDKFLVVIKSNIVNFASTSEQDRSQMDFAKSILQSLVKSDLLESDFEAVEIKADSKVDLEQAKNTLQISIPDFFPAKVEVKVYKPNEADNKKVFYELSLNDIKNEMVETVFTEFASQDRRRVIDIAQKLETIDTSTLRKRIFALREIKKNSPRLITDTSAYLGFDTKVLNGEDLTDVTITTTKDFGLSLNYMVVLNQDAYGGEMHFNQFFDEFTYAKKLDYANNGTAISTSKKFDKDKNMNDGIKNGHFLYIKATDTGGNKYYLVVNSISKYQLDVVNLSDDTSRLFLSNKKVDGKTWLLLSHKDQNDPNDYQNFIKIKSATFIVTDK